MVAMRGREASHPTDPGTSGVALSHLVSACNSSYRLRRQKMGQCSPPDLPSSRPTP